LRRRSGDAADPAGGGLGQVSGVNQAGDSGADVLNNRRQTLALLAVGAGLLVAMGWLGPRFAPRPEPAAKVTAPLPPANRDAFDAGMAGLSVGAELDYIARVVGAWRGPEGDCANPIRITETNGALSITGAGASKRLDIGLVKPGVVRATVRAPTAEKGANYEFSVGLLETAEAAPAPMTVVRSDGAPETWEPCLVK
jgi:hypothetical protein